MTTRLCIANESARRAIAQSILQAPFGTRVTIGEPLRTLDQNAKMWAMLSDVRQQVDWYGSKLTPEEWKVVMTAALKRQKTVPGIDGGFVVIGQNTSDMSKKELAELVELIYAFGASKAVEWTERDA